MKVVVKINGVEILVNAKAEEVEKIEIVISDETVGSDNEERRETRETMEVRAETAVERQEDEGSEAEPHYCNVNCSCKFNQVNNSK